MNTSLKVTGIDHVVLHVKDLARAKKFYVDLLGMEIKRENSWQVFVGCGRQMIGLFAVDKNTAIHGGDEVNHMALQLGDGEYEMVKGLLKEKGIDVSGRRGDPHCIYLSDPDGHRLQLLTRDEP